MRRRPTTIIPDARLAPCWMALTVAQFGQIHPDVAAARKLRQDVFVAEIYLDRLYQHDLRPGAL